MCRTTGISELSGQKILVGIVTLLLLLGDCRSAPFNDDVGVIMAINDDLDLSTGAFTTTRHGRRDLVDNATTPLLMVTNHSHCSSVGTEPSTPLQRQFLALSAPEQRELCFHNATHVYAEFSKMEGCGNNMQNITTCTWRLQCSYYDSAEVCGLSIDQGLAEYSENCLVLASALSTEGTTYDWLSEDYCDLDGERTNVTTGQTTGTTMPSTAPTAKPSIMQLDDAPEGGNDGRPPQGEEESSTDSSSSRSRKHGVMVRIVLVLSACLLW
ncbi:unnamed protein product [Cylindrotheca closterium]|uniref:Subtilisin n=1 Tax=Cylindrotheca closterium TaxID=2856 RepID=A0AAD2CPY7_9STRA|nr:unnamed protein product [Cylindrotheca closterium]